MIQKILILSANPKTTLPLRLDQEMREIDEGLRRSKNRQQFILEKRLALRTEDLRRALLDEEPYFVHFCGHGLGEEGILLEDTAGYPKLVKAESLAELFRLFSERVECVILNACYSEVQAEAIGQHINYVIGMKQAIGDQAAIRFACGFYDAIGAGRTIEDAFEFGKTAIELENIPEGLTPILKRKNCLDIFSMLVPQQSVDELEQSHSIKPEIHISENQEVDSPIRVDAIEENYGANFMEKETAAQKSINENEETAKVLSSSMSMEERLFTRRKLLLALPLLASVVGVAKFYFQKRINNDYIHAIEKVIAQDKQNSNAMSANIKNLELYVRGDKEKLKATRITVKGYVAKMKEYDLQECPMDFQKAFFKHELAWKRFTESWDTAELSSIKNTWSEIQLLAFDYGVELDVE